MERQIYAQLIDWKEKKDRKPLILKGARQVGKTYILKEFSRQKFNH
jgi:predicted AAA+ superfamily ATPase